MKSDDSLYDADHPLEIADQGCFFVGGHYTHLKNDSIMVGQMFVQYQIPTRRTQEYPIVMIHGGGQTGVSFLGTPDGRRGWADFFLVNGYSVFVVDQPARGRSGYFSDPYGEAVHMTASSVSGRWTTARGEARSRGGRGVLSASTRGWPQAELHTQWAGSGIMGDPAFDEFYASQVEEMANAVALELMTREAGAALLDRIGPAILLTHSQSGSMGWTIADARPDLVPAIVAVEPNGPPRYDMKFLGPPNYFDDGELERHWGLTRGPLHFLPKAEGAHDIKFLRQGDPDAPELVRCWLQAEPARQLPNLKAIPVLIVTGEASYHASYDHCTARFLSQAGVKSTLIRLSDLGIRGNGHMMMLERNNLEIASVLHRWLSGKVKRAAV